MEVIFVVHVFVSLFMTGLCWFVQMVHYPLFHQIELDEFPAYEKKNFNTGFITVPLMVIEMTTGLLLLYYNFDILFVFNIFLLGITGLSTFIFQVPIHLKLAQKATTALIRKLILTNWIRTISWTLRAVILVSILYKHMAV